MIINKWRCPRCNKVFEDRVEERLRQVRFSHEASCQFEFPKDPMRESLEDNMRFFGERWIK